MSSAMAAVKKVPKWAWFASAGVVGGVAVMRMRSNEGAQVDKAPDDGTAPGDYGLTAAPIGTGVVAASAGSTGYTGDSGSSAPAFDMPSFISSLGDLVVATRPDPVDVGGIIESVEQGNVGVIGAIGALPGFAGGGGAPQSSTTIQVVSAPTAPAPAPAPAVAPSRFTHTKDNGLKGNARKVWCMCGDVKVADGACWAEGKPCT